MCIKSIYITHHRSVSSLFIEHTIDVYQVKRIALQHGILNEILQRHLPSPLAYVRARACLRVRVRVRARARAVGVGVPWSHPRRSGAAGTAVADVTH